MNDRFVQPENKPIKRSSQGCSTQFFRFDHNIGKTGSKADMYITSVDHNPGIPICSRIRRGYQSTPHKIAANKQLNTGRYVFELRLGKDITG